MRRVATMASSSFCIYDGVHVPSHNAEQQPRQSLDAQTSFFKNDHVHTRLVTALRGTPVKNNSSGDKSATAERCVTLVCEVEDKSQDCATSH